jgi:hypothetical protein
LDVEKLTMMSKTKQTGAEQKKEEQPK